MPAYNFMPQFADSVASGQKRCTIRRKRKRPTKAGDILHLFTGMRTKRCRKLGKTLCLEVQPIEIARQRIVLAGKELNWSGSFILAKADGFRCLNDFFAFYDKLYGLPFAGVLIEW